MSDATSSVEIIGETLKEYHIRRCGTNPETGEPWEPIWTVQSGVAPELVAVWKIQIKELRDKWENDISCQGRGPRTRKQQNRRYNDGGPSPATAASTTSMVLPAERPTDERHSHLVACANWEAVDTPAYNPLPELATPHTMQQQFPPNDRSLGIGSLVTDSVISSRKPVEFNRAALDPVQSSPCQLGSFPSPSLGPQSENYQYPPSSWTPTTSPLPQSPVRTLALGRQIKLHPAQQWARVSEASFFIEFASTYPNPVDTEPLKDTRTSSPRPNANSKYQIRFFPKLTHLGTSPNRGHESPKPHRQDQPPAPSTGSAFLEDAVSGGEDSLWCSDHADIEFPSPLPEAPATPEQPVSMYHAVSQNSQELCRECDSGELLTLAHVRAARHKLCVKMGYTEDKRRNYIGQIFRSCQELVGGQNAGKECDEEVEIKAPDMFNLIGDPSFCGLTDAIACGMCLWGIYIRRLQGIAEEIVPLTPWLCEIRIAIQFEDVMSCEAWDTFRAPRERRRLYPRQVPSVALGKLLYNSLQTFSAMHDPQFLTLRLRSRCARPFKYRRFQFSLGTIAPEYSRCSGGDQAERWNPITSIDSAMKNKGETPLIHGDGSSAPTGTFEAKPGASETSETRESASREDATATSMGVDIAPSSTETPRGQKDTTPRRVDVLLVELVYITRMRVRRRSTACRVQGAGITESATGSTKMHAPHCRREGPPPAQTGKRSRQCAQWEDLSSSRNNLARTVPE
ncbi:hypothetical protein K438DRAFT_1780135 [Mycena galopus ATCC 62051]|nr:hypothetical protein K438DRAFT_1780135 [Mycena galopus ATCC 62051]